jgi:cation transport regulator ChaC
MAGAKGPRGWSYEYLGNLVKEFRRHKIADDHHCALYDRILEIIAART